MRLRAVCLARALGRGSLGSSPQEGGSRDEGGRVEDAGSGSRRWAEEEWRWRARGRKGAEADGQARARCSGLVSGFGGPPGGAGLGARCMRAMLCVHLQIRPRAPGQAAPAPPMGAGADPHRGRPAVPNVELAGVSGR